MFPTRLFTISSIVSILLWSTTDAFAPSTPLQSRTTAATTSFTRQYALPPPTDIVDYADLLNQVAHTSQMLADAAAASPDAVPSGWWGDYISLFKAALNGVHNVIDPPLRSIGVEQTWGLSIGLFTIMARALLLPVSIQQSKSSEYMKALKPYVAEIKAKYKNNQDAQNRAVGKLYEDANQNPLSGCLVSLAQIPIFLGLYRGIRLLALDGVLEEPFLFIPSLQGPVSPPDYRGLDWLTTGWTPSDGALPIPPLGWETTLAFCAMPLILVLLQSATMTVLQPPVDSEASEEEKKQMENTQRVIKFLPLMIGFFSLQVPAGLTIYWFSSNIFTLSQSLGVRAYFAANPPEIELPDYWDQMNDKKDFKDMTPEERRKASEAGLAIGPSFDDLVNESKFHVFVERQPFVKTTEAWKRIESSKDSSPVTPELEEWVKSSTITKLEESNGHAAPFYAEKGEAKGEAAEKVRSS